jgi:hypothetical protein
MESRNWKMRSLCIIRKGSVNSESFTFFTGGLGGAGVAAGASTGSAEFFLGLDDSDKALVWSGSFFFLEASGEPGDRVDATDSAVFWDTAFVGGVLMADGLAGADLWAVAFSAGALDTPAFERGGFGVAALDGAVSAFPDAVDLAGLEVADFAFGGGFPALLWDFAGLDVDIKLEPPLRARAGVFDACALWI